MNLLCNSIQQVHTSTVNIIIVNVNTGLSEKIPNDLVDIDYFDTIDIEISEKWISNKDKLESVVGFLLRTYRRNKEFKYIHISSFGSDETGYDTILTGCNVNRERVEVNVGVDKPVLMAESLPLENIKEPIHITIPLTSMKIECGNCVTVN